MKAKCPKCSKTGGVIARKDAYVNFFIEEDGYIDWSDTSDVTVCDETVYECCHCGESLMLEEIERANRNEDNWSEVDGMPMNFEDYRFRTVLVDLSLDEWIEKWRYLD